MLVLKKLLLKERLHFENLSSDGTESARRIPMNHEKMKESKRKQERARESKSKQERHKRKQDKARESEKKH